MIRWKIYKARAKHPIRARNNLMNFYNWSKAIKYIGKKLGANYLENLEARLKILESVEVHSIERRT